MKLGSEQIAIQQFGGHLVVALRGEIDDAFTDLLDAELAAALRREISTVQLELGEVTFLNSMGLRSLLQFRDTAAAEGIQVTIGAASHIVRRLLEIVQLEELFGLS